MNTTDTKPPEQPEDITLTIKEYVKFNIDKDAPFAQIMKHAVTMKYINTCDRCTHYLGDPPQESWFTMENCTRFNSMYDMEKDGVTPNGDASGVMVGPKFGCIHWEQA